MFRRRPNNFNQIVLIVNGGVGDFIMLWPLIKKLSQEYSVFVLPKRPVVEKFITDFALNISTISFEHLSSLSTSAFIYSYGYDNFNLKIVRKFKLSPHLGFVLGNSIIDFNRRFLRSKHLLLYNNHIDNNLNLLKVLGVTSYFNLLDLVLEDIDLPKYTETSIVINLKTKGFSRNWPITRYLELIKILRSHIVFNLILVGGPEDIEAASEFQANYHDLSLINNLVGKKSFKETAEVISKAHLFISGDSGLLHIAGACTKTPTIALFGPTSPVNYSWLYSNVTSFSRNPSPCNFGPKKLRCNCTISGPCNFMHNIDPKIIATFILNNLLK